MQNVEKCNFFYEERKTQPRNETEMVILKTLKFSIKVKSKRKFTFLYASFFLQYLKKKKTECLRKVAYREMTSFFEPSKGKRYLITVRILIVTC